MPLGRYPSHLTFCDSCYAAPDAVRKLSAEQARGGGWVPYFPTANHRLAPALVDYRGGSMLLLTGWPTKHCRLF